MSTIKVGSKVQIHSRPSNLRGVRLRSESGVVTEIFAGPMYVVKTESGTTHLVQADDLVVLGE